MRLCFWRLEDNGKYHGHIDQAEIHILRESSLSSAISQHEWTVLTKEPDIGVRLLARLIFVIFIVAIEKWWYCRRWYPSGSDHEKRHAQWKACPRDRWC